MRDDTGGKPVLRSAIRAADRAGFRRVEKDAGMHAPEWRARARAMQGEVACFDFYDGLVMAVCAGGCSIHVGSLRSECRWGIVSRGRSTMTPSNLSLIKGASRAPLARGMSSRAPARHRCARSGVEFVFSFPWVRCCPLRALIRMDPSICGPSVAMRSRAA